MRLLILTGPTPDWVRRVRGQLSDLPVSLATLALVVDGQPEPQLARQLGPLAEHRDAAIVAWLMTDRLDAPAASQPEGAVPAVSSTRVAIWFARTGRLFSRPLGGPWSRLSASDRSAVLELGALSVRSAVRSLLLDPTAEPFRDAEAPRASAGSATTGTPARAVEANRSSSASASASARGGVPAGAATPSALSPSAVSPSAESSKAATSSAATPSAATPSAASPSAALASVPPGALPPSAVPSAVRPSALPSDVATDVRSVEAEARAAAAASAGQGSLPHDAAQPQDGPIVAPPGAELVATDPASSAGSARALALDLHWSAELGVTGQLPGPPADFAAGFAAGVRARSQAWAVLVLAQLGLPVRAKLGPSELEVLQHALLAEGQYLRWNTGAWSFGPVLRAGLRVARRGTVAGDPGLVASGAKWLPGLRLGLGWVSELRWGEHFGATLRGVLHWEPVRPAYEVQTPQGDPVSYAQPWAVQPSLELGGNWYW